MAVALFVTTCLLCVGMLLLHVPILYGTDSSLRYGNLVLRVGGHVRKNNTVCLVVRNDGARSVQLLDARLWFMRSALPATRVCKRQVSYAILPGEAVEWSCHIPQIDPAVAAENVCNAKLRGQINVFVEDREGGILSTKDVKLDYPCMDLGFAIPTASW